MLGVFATGRKAQNYYHYLSMTNSAYFDLLSTNTQVFLTLIMIIQNPISEKADAAFTLILSTCN